MAELRREYDHEPPDESSLQSRVTHIISKKVLLASDVMDRGVYILKDTPMGRFSLETGFAFRVERTIYDMQAFLDRAATLRPEKSSSFLVDPHSTLLSVLRNAMELSELNVAWIGLNKRMELAYKSFLKYESEFAAETEDQILLSPISTDPGLYDVFPRGQTFMSDVNYLFNNVPHHKVQLPDNYDLRRDWLPFKMPVPAHLTRAFPSRMPEEKPATVYYTPAGERKEIALSERTSRGAGPDFVPPIPPVGTRRRRQYPKTAAEDTYSSDEEEGSEVGSVKGKGKEKHLQGLGLMSSGIDYKTANEMLVPASPRDVTSKAPVPGANLPDALQGMARSGPYDSISQAPRKGWDKTSHIAFVPRKVPTTGLHVIPEERSEAAFHSEQAGKPLPPHMGARRARTADDDEREGRRGRWNHSASREGSRSPTRGRSERGRSPASAAGAGGQGGPSDDSDEDENRGGRGRRGGAPPPIPPRKRRRTPPGLAGGRSPSPPPPSDPGAGGTDKSSDSGRSGRRRFPYIASGAPYGTVVPTIEPKLKVESLPEWDGNHETAIDYFWHVSQTANLLGWIPKALGFWLPSRLKKDSQVQLWFSTLPTERQSEMRSHYLVYLQAIKDGYLGKKWQLKMNLQFEAQSFRQEGHEKETPQMFLGRRIRYLRLLTKVEEGGAEEVFLIMQKAPISWSTIIVQENVKSTEELYARVNEHEEALVEIVRRSAPDAFSIHNLASTLRRMGFTQNSNAPNAPNRQFRRANFTEADEPAQELDAPEETPVSTLDGEGDTVLKQVYQVLQKRQ
ncbi:hypothetical protein B0H16DRAFT_1487201 [Mycena metata]|uniref:Uncharacterized protein n=1 Tax=Mycena metata TaxID=1033252 RepID=A0AAD7GDN7_9AGAR|nr:hypothetical protein B0H16DRAFT_1487201 [Mycena metata]